MSKSDRTNRRHDLDFLAAIKQATLDELLDWRRRLAPKNAPAWKRIAVQRRIERLVG